MKYWYSLLFLASPWIIKRLPDPLIGGLLLVLTALVCINALWSLDDGCR